MDSTSNKSQITGLILAGGAGRRVGGKDKGLIEWRDKPLVEHVFDRLDRQVGQLVISCNRNLADYKRYGSITVEDTRLDFQGPLAGIEAASQIIETQFLVVVACDMPQIPHDLVSRLMSPLIEQDVGAPELSYAHDGIRGQFLCAAMKRDCLLSLGNFLEQGHRAVHQWYQSKVAVSVDFSDQANAFANFNRLP